MLGGKREGAGRKRGGHNSKRKEMLRMAEDISREVLSRVDVVKIWMKLLRCNSPKVVFASLQYLTDRSYGRPVQMIAGDPNKPVNIQLSWNGSPQWMQAENITPVSNLLADPLAQLISETIQKDNEEGSLG